MGIENLTEIEIVVGIFDSIFVIISFIIGIKLILKYFSHKQVSLITIGLAWIFFGIAWTGGALSFFLYIMFNATLDHTLILIAANAFSPLALICWIFSFCKLLYPNLIKIIIPIYTGICIIYEIFLFILIFNSPDYLGTFYGTYYYRPKLFPLLFYLFAVTTVLVTGIILTKESFKSIDQKLRWRGRFLLLAFISLTISMVLEGLFHLSAYYLAVVRIIHISSAFEYYLGFFLPDRIAKLLIKDEEI